MKQIITTMMKQRLARKRVISIACALTLIAAGSLLIQNVSANPDAYSVAEQAILSETNAPVLIPVVDDADPTVLVAQESRYFLSLTEPGSNCPDYAPCHIATLHVQNLNDAYARQNEDEIVELTGGIRAQLFEASPPEAPISLVFEVEEYQVKLGMPGATEEEIIEVANRMLEDAN